MITTVPLSVVPSLDALMANPGNAATLPPEVAQALLIGLVSLQPRSNPVGYGTNSSVKGGSSRS
jgi:hypothetical protein